MKLFPAATKVLRFFRSIHKIMPAWQPVMISSQLTEAPFMADWASVRLRSAARSA